MASSGGKKRSGDVATTSTSADAIPNLQARLSSALTDARKRNAGGVHVGVVGPGAPEKGQTYAPQVLETLGTMTAAGRTGDTLHVYTYKRDARTAPAAPVPYHAPSGGGSAHVVMHEFDVTNPNPTDTAKSDVLIATRVMNPVLSHLKRNALDTGTGERSAAVEGLRGKAKSDARVLTDVGAASILKSSHRDIFAKATYSETGRDVRGVATFSFGAAAEKPKKGPGATRSMTALPISGAAVARSGALASIKPPPVRSGAKKTLPPIDAKRGASTAPADSAAARRKAYADSLKKPVAPPKRA